MSLDEDSRKSLSYLGMGSCLGVCFGLYFICGFSNFLNYRINSDGLERDTERGLRIPEYEKDYSDELVFQERKILIN